MLSAEDRRTLEIPARAIDIAEWLFGLGNGEYRATARAHLGAGHFRLPDGRRGLFDAEAFPGVVTVNHHREEEARPDYVRVRSADSRAWVLAVIPVPLDVCWEMRIRPLAPRRSELECRLQMRFPVRALELLARMLLVPAVVRRHVRAQTAGFCASVAARAAAGTA